jgi:hypothetical protein
MRNGCRTGTGTGCRQRSPVRPISHSPRACCTTSQPASRRRARSAGRGKQVHSGQGFTAGTASASAETIHPSIISPISPIGACAGNHGGKSAASNAHATAKRGHQNATPPPRHHYPIPTHAAHVGPGDVREVPVRVRLREEHVVVPRRAAARCVGAAVHWCYVFLMLREVSRLESNWNPIRVCVCVCVCVCVWGAVWRVKPMRLTCASWE